jgi:hypothetical protein
VAVAKAVAVSPAGESEQASGTAFQAWASVKAPGAKPGKGMAVLVLARLALAPVETASV